MLLRVLLLMLLLLLIDHEVLLDLVVIVRGRGGGQVPTAAVTVFGVHRGGAAARVSLVLGAQGGRRAGHLLFLLLLIFACFLLIGRPCRRRLRMLVVALLMVSMVRAAWRLRLRRVPPVAVARPATMRPVRMVLVLVVLVLVMVMVVSSTGRGSCASSVATAGRFATEADATVAEASPFDGAPGRPAGRVQADRAAERAPTVTLERRAEIRR